jgi:hypothetical protein
VAAYFEVFVRFPNVSVEIPINAETFCCIVPINGDDLHESAGVSARDEFASVEIGFDFNNGFNEFVVELIFARVFRDKVVVLTAGETVSEVIDNARDVVASFAVGDVAIVDENGAGAGVVGLKDEGDAAFFAKVIIEYEVFFFLF